MTMAEVKTTWEKVRGWYHYPALKDPKVVKSLDGGACFDFKKLETLVDGKFVKDVSGKGSMSEERCYEGVFTHEIGHYMVFPRDLATLMLLGKFTDDFFQKSGKETCGFIVQTYCDMANDTASVLAEQRTNPVLDIRKACQAAMDDKINSSVRAVMLAYLHHQAQRQYELQEELRPYLEQMRSIDFLNESTEKMRQGVWAFGNIIIDMLKKYGGVKGPGGGPNNLKSDHSDCDIPTILGKASEGDIKEALGGISGKISRGEYKKVKEWMKTIGVELPEPKGAPAIGTSEGELPVDQEVLEYYKQLSMRYPLVVTKKMIDTKTTVRSWSDTEKWRPGTDPNLALPSSSGGMFLPGITRSIHITGRPVRSSDYKVPHLLIVEDSSGSMPDPKDRKSYAVLGGYCAARSYHLHDSHIGVINFSGSSFYLPYTRSLDEALGAISAYQGGGTTVDVEMLKKMLGPEMAELYMKNPERNMAHIPEAAKRKEIVLPLSQFETAFTPRSIDVVMFTDGGISNLDEVLDFFDEKVELNRATIVLTHHFDQELRERDKGKIRIHRVEDEKDIPHIVIGATQRHFSAFAEGLQ